MSACHHLLLLCILKIFLPFLSGTRIIVPGDQGTLETCWHLGCRGPVKHWHKVSVKGGRAHLELMESCHSGMAEL